MSITPYVSKAAKPAQFVYYLLDGSGAILYIGRSADVARRIRQHYYNASKPDSPVHIGKAEWFFDVRAVSMVGPLPRAEACALERREIENVQPRGNLRFTSRDKWPLENRVSA